MTEASTICRCGHSLAMHERVAQGKQVRSACRDVGCECCVFVPRVLHPLTPEEDATILRGLRECLEEMKGEVEVVVPTKKVIQVGE